MHEFIYTSILPAIWEFNAILLTQLTMLYGIHGALLFSFALLMVYCRGSQANEIVNSFIIYEIDGNLLQCWAGLVRQLYKQRAVARIVHNENVFY